MTISLISSLLWDGTVRAHSAPDADAMTVPLPGINYGDTFDAKPPEGWGLRAKEFRS